MGLVEKADHSLVFLGEGVIVVRKVGLESLQLLYFASNDLITILELFIDVEIVLYLLLLLDQSISKLHQGGPILLFHFDQIGLQFLTVIQKQRIVLLFLFQCITQFKYLPQLTLPLNGPVRFCLLETVFFILSVSIESLYFGLELKNVIFVFGKLMFVFLAELSFPILVNFGDFLVFQESLCNFSDFLLEISNLMILPSNNFIMLEEHILHFLAVNPLLLAGYALLVLHHLVQGRIGSDQLYFL